MENNRMTMKEARYNSRMTVSAACAAMQISKEKLLSWESGRTLPAADEALRMAAVYGLKLNDIDFSRTDRRRMTFDTSELRGRILGEYGTLSRFAAAAGMDPRKLSRRLTGKAQFTIDETGTIRKILHLNDDEVRAMFFSPVDGISGN